MELWDTRAVTHQHCRLISFHLKSNTQESRELLGSGGEQGAQEEKQHSPSSSLSAPEKREEMESVHLAGRKETQFGFLILWTTDHLTQKTQPSSLGFYLAHYSDLRTLDLLGAMTLSFSAMVTY